MAAKQSLHEKLPLTLPQPCPICGKAVILVGVLEWGADDGEIIHAEYDCETEPDLDSDDWPEWQAGHWSMPYVDWLPWEQGMIRWLNRRFFYQYSEPPSTSTVAGTSAVPQADRPTP